MEWLKPHIARVDQYCASLKENNTYVHIPNGLQRPPINGNSNANNNSPKCNCGAADCQADPEDIGHSYAEQLLRFQQIAEYRKKIQPVSVIVSDKSNSGSTSPTSSLSDSNNPSNENDASGTEENSTESTDSSSPNKKQKCEYNYKPVPMVRKSRRRFISPEQKDESYWERRRRNNEAAKKSREQRREKEIEVNRKCSDLVKENSGLKFSVMNLQERNTQMQNTLQMYKELLYKNNLL